MSVNCSIDYANAQAVKKWGENLHRHAREFIKISNTFPAGMWLRNMFPRKGEEFHDMFMRHDMDKINLSVGMEFLLKALYLSEGFVLHRVNGSNVPKKISELSQEDDIDYRRTIYFEELKNHLPDIGGDLQTYRQALNIIQDWRNALIHQARGPNRVDGGEIKAIEETIIGFHNSIVSKNGI